ncbi:hypothetical protein PTSG_07525 [Salpingoeca rosetta]|uniref:Uncharacterized protein n=1 Tax=Salpingoeca rosetta (strain ATCC 50818 / BSB-021) TaxID=946362 RepID=F2UH07_SALR5|nr:uncharacterized protein PTSG_07525 [Salpingoeca rosetta]EGD76406.1 hypothetical protein PTSG_07525 [Salpingoeca rosetta]|eukprot:XP_004991321.1 hypothetical protein PTSG_07525 [Salpingoeca rosetta]
MSAPKEQPRGDEEGKEQHVVAAQAATQGKEGGDGSDGEKKQVRVLTTEEAAMLDDDEFFKAYKEGRIQRRPGHWTEENFEEEMEKHPLFMTHEPTKEEYVNNPHLSALQEMFAELTPIERADHHKTHGNEAYKKARAAGKNK